MAVKTSDLNKTVPKPTCPPSKPNTGMTPQPKPQDSGDRFPGSGIRQKPMPQPGKK